MNTTLLKEYGLMNCILKGRTVILDFMRPSGKRCRRYHRYKTYEKAEHMWNIYGQGVHKIIENEEQ